MDLYEFQTSHSYIVRPHLKSITAIIKTYLFVFIHSSMLSAHTETRKGLGCPPWLSTCSSEAGFSPELEAYSLAMPLLLPSSELGFRCVQGALLDTCELNSTLRDSAASVVIAEHLSGILFGVLWVFSFHLFRFEFCC